MPLESGRSESAFHHNVAELIKAGHPRAQALAISYKEKRGSDAMSAREYDSNGWPEIKKNPISKTGVYPYLGKQIDSSLEPEKTYMVLRPAEELSDPETIESFKLLPWVYIHPSRLLGAEEDGRVSPDEKGVAGVTGEDVFFEGDTLYANLKLFSDNLQELVDSGEVPELSLGYGCKYKLSSGVYNGISYDAIQHTIRGNHLASVPKGRMGPEVAVLDHLTVTFDAKDITMPDTEKAMDAVKEELKGIGDSVKGIGDAMKALDERMSGLDKRVHDMEEEKETGDESEEEKEKKEKEAKDKAARDAEEEKKKEEEKKAEDKRAMDAAIKIALDAALKPLAEVVESQIKAQAETKKAQLLDRLNTHGIALDSANKPLPELLADAAKKIGLVCEQGQEQVALDAYFHDRSQPIDQIGFALDTKSGSSDSLEQHIAKRAA
jgi:hypothetical protein